MPSNSRPADVCRQPSADANMSSRRLELIAIPGLPDLLPGDNLARRILNAAQQADLQLKPGDVLVIAQKAVSKCEGAYAVLDEVAPSCEAQELAASTSKDARLVELILQDADEVLRAREGLIVVAHRSGHVMANAGIDSSNVTGNGQERVLRLPADADKSAAHLRMTLKMLTGIDVGVVINDSWGRAWRNGTVGHALGVAGLPALWDRRGEADMHGRPLRATQIGLADEIAAAASLLMGAGAERQPVVIVRGLCLPAGDGVAKDLLRDKAHDVFR